jgi:RNA 2',3'-cyclic 3'-phosphodiesterase
MWVPAFAGTTGRKMIRLFVGIELSPELKLRLSLLQSGVAGAKWVDPGNFHLTLRFIGEVDEGIALDIDEALLRIKARPFSLQLAGAGVFGGDKPRQLWAGVEREPALATLQGKIEQAVIRVGLPPELRKYAPHVTLARLWQPKPGDIQQFLATHAQFRAEPLRIDRFSLIASYPTKAGSVFEDQADYELQG